MFFSGFSSTACTQLDNGKTRYTRLAERKLFRKRSELALFRSGENKRAARMVNKVTRLCVRTVKREFTASAALHATGRARLRRRQQSSQHFMTMPAMWHHRRVTSQRAYSRRGESLFALFTASDI